MYIIDDDCKFKTLAIVGNGFDLNHGYHTSFFDFVQNTKHSSLDDFKNLCADINTIKTWYNFEENINKLSRKLFELRIIDGDYDIGTTIYKTFNDIHSLLIEYLKKETSSKKLIKKQSLEQYLDTETITFNFNYTNTVEAYTKKVIYMHGSLEENDIILGYDYRDEPCLADFNEMRWSKIFCRQSLAFRRILRQRMGLKTDSKKYKSLMTGLESYLTISHSAKGICDSDIANINDGKLITKLINEIEIHPIPNICYDSINTIVILGHGIEADKLLLKNIISSCNNLKEIIIFHYDGESADSIEMKKAFFLEYCSKIKTIQY